MGTISASETLLTVGQLVSVPFSTGDVIATTYDNTDLASVIKLNNEICVNAQSFTAPTPLLARSSLRRTRRRLPSPR